MAKRKADVQITKDDQDGEGDGEVEMSGHWKEASADKIAKRQIVTVRRKNEPKMEVKEAEKTTDAKLTSTGADLGFLKQGGDKWNCDQCLLPNDKSATKCAGCNAARPGAPAQTMSADNPLAKFLLKADEWECGTCSVKNEKSALKCKACEEPNPNAGGAKSSPNKKQKTEDAPAITFGFGAPSDSSSSAEQFTFDPKGFGGSLGGVTFGNVQGDGFKVATEAADFSTATSLKANAQTAKEFEGKKAKESGDESDKIVHKATCKVFELREFGATGDGSSSSKAEKKFVDVGSGELRINTYTTSEGTTKGRMILRADKTQRLVLNVPIFQGLKFSQEDKSVRFIGYKPTESGSSTGLDGVTYALKFKTKDEATGVFTNIEKVVNELKGK